MLRARSNQSDNLVGILVGILVGNLVGLITISDVSFDYWLRLHFGLTTSPHDSASKLIKNLGHASYPPGYDKHNKHPDMKVLYPLLREAMMRAR